MLLVQRKDVGGRQCKTDLIRRDLFRQPVNGVELRHRLLVGVVKTFGCQRALADVNDHERHVHAAFDHLGQIDLRRQAHLVIAIRREVRRLDVVVSVERDNTFVNAFGFGNQRGLAALRSSCLRRTLPDRDLREQADR